MTISQTNGSAISTHVQNLIVHGNAPITSVPMHAVAATPQLHLADLGPSWVVLGSLFVIYLFSTYCLKCVCEKCDREPGILIWIPVLNLIRLLQAGKSSGWLFLLFFVPGLNIAVVLLMWAKICQARGKSEWLALLLFIPLVNIGLLLFLAFAD